MTLPLVLLIGIMVVSGLWLFRQTLNVRPWLNEAPLPGAPGHVSFHVPAAKVGLWVFLAIATSLFVLLVSAYSVSYTHLTLPTNREV